MEQQKEFSYWKYPWNKWAVLCAGVLELFVLRNNLNEYKTVLSLGIYSASEWNQYAIQQKSVCMLNALLAAALIGIFFIGALVHSKKSARLAESLLLLLMAATIGIWMLVWYQQLQSIWVFAVLFAVMLVGFAYTFCQYRKEKKGKSEVDTK